MPRHVLNAKDVPPPERVRPQNISFLLLGVIRLDAERYQILSDALLLLRILGTQGLGERVPELLEDNYQFLRLDVLLTRLDADFLEKPGQLR